jgi:hypothetical protein
MQWLIPAVIVSFLAFGTSAAWLARERGRAPFPWVIVGTLLGPFALLLVGFAPRQVDGVRFKECVECLEPINMQAITCSHCAADQTTDD